MNSRLLNIDVFTLWGISLIGSFCKIRVPNLDPWSVRYISLSFVKWKLVCCLEIEISARRTFAACPRPTITVSWIILIKYTTFEVFFLNKETFNQSIITYGFWDTSSGTSIRWYIFIPSWHVTLLSRMLLESYSSWIVSGYLVLHSSQKTLSHVKDT